MSAERERLVGQINRRVGCARSVGVWPRNERVELASADYDGVHFEGGRTTLRDTAQDWNVPLKKLLNYRANHLRRLPPNAQAQPRSCRSEAKARTSAGAPCWQATAREGGDADTP